MKDKLKRFIDCYIETETCNLRCSYCYITQQRKFNNKLVEFEHSPETIRKALSQKRLGGICLFNFCAGGETLLAASILPIVEALLEEGHYVMVVTNGTIRKRFEEVCLFSEECRSRLFFKFSFHYLELKRLGLFETYFENIETVKDAGCSFTVEMTPCDEEIEYIEEIKQVCNRYLGTLCHLTIARDDRTNKIEHLSKKTYKEYKGIWGTFHSSLFDFKSDIFYKKRKEFCYAGAWSAVLNLSTGDMRQCYCGKVLDNIYRDYEAELYFEPIGKKCKEAHCYNGHAFLSLGVIPNLETPRFADLRDKVNSRGEHWLKDNMREFMEQKLSDNNERLDKTRKLKSFKMKGK